MKALIFGSTGLVGSCLLRELISSEKYTEIISFVRRKSDIVPPKVREIQSDLKDLNPYSEEFKCDSVFIALGTTIKKAGSQEKFREVDYTFVMNIATQAKKMGSRSLFMVSSLGADPNSGVFYSRTKGETERDVGLLNLPSFYVFRPSLLLGKRAEFRLGEKIGEVMAYGLSFALQGPLKKYKPIGGAQVARSMLIKSYEPLPGKHIFESDEIGDIA